ncbi:MAG: LPS assembly lipoprotein LptE [Woeseiaceae bacterium]
MPERGLIFSLLLLAGCGFQLQGALTFPPQLERTYIQAVDSYSPFYRDLRTALVGAGIEVTDTAADATATLTIAFDETDQRVLSVSARNVPTEYEVYYTIEYLLHSGEDNLIERQTLTLTRDYTYDSTLVLGKAQEEELLREAIVDDLVRIVLKQISAL